MAQPTDPGRGAALTLTEAAAATGVSRSTIKRRQAEFAHAYRDSTGAWRIPVTDLLGAGLHLQPRPGSSTEATDPPTQVAGPDQTDKLTQVLDQVLTLTEQLAAERTARAVAEARASAMADNLEDLRRSLRALSGPPAAQEPAPPPVQASTPAPAPPDPPRRRWWSRGR